MDKIFIASDHAGFSLKEKTISFLKKNKFEVIDLGPLNDQRMDYPDSAKLLCKKILDPNNNSLGILICGSGQGMAMTANKYKGIRAALCWSEEVALLARSHNNANILCLSAREIEEELNFKIINKFLNTDFEGGRHQLRIDKMNI